MKITSSRARRLGAFIAFIAWLILVVWFWDSLGKNEDFPFDRLLAVVLGLIPLIPLIEKEKKEPVDASIYDFDSAQHRQNREFRSVCFLACAPVQGGTIWKDYDTVSRGHNLERLCYSFGGEVE